jgi:acyl dehydratase
LTTDEIRLFAIDFDRQPVHLGEVEATTTVLGGFSASGWHSCVIVSGLMNEAYHRVGLEASLLQVEEVRWKSPVRPGDVLVANGSISHRSASEEGTDLITSCWDVRSASALTLMTMTAIHRVKSAGEADVV